MRKLWNHIVYVVIWTAAVYAMPAAGSEVVSVDQAILQASIESGVDHELLRAIATVESGRDAKAIGALKEVGLFQLRPKYFRGAASTDPSVNARAAASYLVYLKRRCKAYGPAWFVCFNTGPNRQRKLAEPTKFVYYQKVMAAKRAGRQVASQP